MRILIIGSGAREHAIGWALAASAARPALFFAPGNAGTESLGPSLPADLRDPHSLLRAARSVEPDLTVVGPEAPLAAGVVDRFEAAGFRIVGPCQAAAQIESSKAFAKALMAEAGIPTAPWQVFEDPQAALAYVRTAPLPLVVKADGLAAGKGVTVCATRAEAEDAVDRLMVQGAFGEAGRRVVVEEALEGEEVSVLALTDGRDVALLPPARDHKRLLAQDRGPNTGGMGAVAPAPVGPGVLGQAEAILRRAVGALAARGTPYRGVLYAGLMETAGGVRVLEFNCRLGDPEAQAILPLLDTDLVDALLATVEGRVGTLQVRWRPGAAVAVVVAGGRYPEAADHGTPIEGVREIPPDILVFHAGTARGPDGRLVTAGGRILTLVAVGPDVEAARRRAVEAAEAVRFPGRHYRPDIGLRRGRPVAASAPAPSADRPAGPDRLRPLPIAGGAPDRDRSGPGDAPGRDRPLERDAPRPSPSAARVAIIVGSDSDLPVVEEHALPVLRHFAVPYEVTVASAHRSPERVRQLAGEAEERGWQVIIAAAGGAAHLAGVVAAQTVLPVIGVPLDATPLRGLDALLATVQMPPGVPVATVAIGGWGMHNAALLAVQILATADPELRERVRQGRARLARSVEEKAARVAEHLARGDAAAAER